MYEKRIRIFAIVSASLLLICILRLGQMQLVPNSFVQEEIAKLKGRGGSTRQLKTVRGRILDRNFNVLATDEARFELCIDYELTSVLDERIRSSDAEDCSIWRAAISDLVFSESKTPVDEELKNHFDQCADCRDFHKAQRVIETCTHFGLERGAVEEKFTAINDNIWDKKTFYAWVRNDPDPNLIARYGGIGRVKLSAAVANFKERFPRAEDRRRLLAKVGKIAGMSKPVSLFDLDSEDDFFTAQMEFMNVDGVRIQPKGHRYYPYKTVAAQTIGWVGRVGSEEDKKLFADANDELLDYVDGELCGRIDGVEYVCETILRGKRGKEVRNIDNQLANRTDIRLGKDVRLTLDIELQKEVEDYLANHEHDPNCGPGMAAVVIDVASGDILVLASLPLFDLNLARENYADLAGANILNGRLYKPLINRAINWWYPPGSVIKPLIFIAGRETGVVTASEVISCPAQKAPQHWPSCWIWNRNHWNSHDNQWPGMNKARNAIKGSCNIYFSRLAGRIEPRDLQQWLFKFGYGRSIVRPPAVIAESQLKRNFRHRSGTISATVPKGPVRRFGQIPPLAGNETRWFGIGQGRLQVTPLQVANAMAAIARRGVYIRPQLFLDDPNDPNSNMRSSPGAVDLGVSPETMDVVYDGMSAVVNESGGTANRTFSPLLDELAQRGVKMYGKTGSTEHPDNAWFAGFATDGAGRTISIAVVIERGQSGSRDAAPLARDIIQLAMNHGYVGQAPNTEER